jgi:hypothetical protein
MPNFAFRVNVAAGGRVANALAGSPFEFVPRDSKVAVALAVQAIQTVPGTPPNTNQGEVTTNITFGAELQLQNGVPALERSDGAGALIPENVLVDDVAEAGDRLVVELLNAGAAGNDVSGVVRILPI